MTIQSHVPVTHELRPDVTVVGVGGAGGNAIDNMITAHLEGVEFVACNTDAQALANCLADRRVQLGATVTRGLGAGARPEVGRAAAEESLDEILGQLSGSHMVFVTAGLGGGTGTGAAPVIARAARERGVLTVGVVTKPFRFEGAHRMRLAEAGLAELRDGVDALIVVPNQNLFRLASEETTFADAFRLADQVLHTGVRGVADLMVVPGLVNLDFADVRIVMAEMGEAMMGTGEGEGERRAVDAAEAAISNPLLDDVSLRGARRPHQHHRRPRHDPVRGRRGRDADPRGGRPGGQHHLRLHVRSGDEGPGADLRGRHRDHAGTADGGCAAAGRACRRAGASRAVGRPESVRAAPGGGGGRPGVAPAHGAVGGGCAGDCRRGRRSGAARRDRPAVAGEGAGVPGRGPGRRRAPAIARAGGRCGSRAGGRGSRGAGRHPGPAPAQARARLGAPRAGGAGVRPVTGWGKRWRFAPRRPPPGPPAGAGPGRGAAGVRPGRGGAARRQAARR